MNFRVIVQVQAEHLSKAIEEFTPALVKFGEIHKIPFEDTYLLDMKTISTTLASNAGWNLANRGVAHNFYGVLGNSLYMWSMRFDHVGELKEKYTLDPSELAVTARSLMASMLWPDGCNPETAGLRSNCVGQRFEWDDQLKNGRRYAVLNLLE